MAARGRILSAKMGSTVAIPAARGRILSATMGSMPYAAPRGRILYAAMGSVGAANPITVVATSDLTVAAKSAVTLAAALSDLSIATVWEWQQLSGPTATLTPNGDTCVVTCPTPIAPGAVVIQVRATLADVVTDWEPINLTIQRQKIWISAGGTLRPVGPTPLIVPSKPPGYGNLPVDPPPVTPPVIPPVAGALIGDSSTIACWGDSLTFGTGSSGGGYVTKLQADLVGGRVTFNGGRGGESSQEIAIRQGGQSLTLSATGGSIPASGAVAVTYAETISWSTGISWSSVGTLNGIPGTINRAVGVTNLTFTRTTAGTATATVSQPWTSTLGVSYRDNVQVLWAGRNDVGNGTDQAVIKARILASNASMVAYLMDTAKPYVILSVCNRYQESSAATGADLTIYNNILDTNATMAATHGAHYIDVRSYMIQNGLSDAGIVPTSADLAAVAADTMPPSLTVDGQHFNDAGYAIIEKLVFNKMVALQYLPVPVIAGPYTRGLAWQLPSDINLQSKKIFAHFFGPYPERFNNNPVATDTYSVSFNNPYTTSVAAEGPMKNFGGYFRGRPMVQPVAAAGVDWLLEDSKRAVRQAQVSGIDGFCFDVLGISGANWDRYVKLCAAASTLYPSGGFWTMPMLDANGIGANQALGVTTTACAAALNTLLTYASSYKNEAGAYVVGTFYHDVQTPAKWAAIKAALLANHGKTMVWASVFRNVAVAANYDNWATGYWGGGATPLKGANQDSSWVATTRARGEKIFPPCWVTDVRPKASVADEAVGFSTQIAYWTKIIGWGADLVQIPTWSDYSEGASIEPTAHAGWSNLDLNSYYIYWLKYGSAPAIVRDVVFMAHRGQFWDAPITSGQLVRMAQWVNQNGGRGASAGPKKNIVQTVSFLTAPADISVTIGGVTQTYTAPAGMFVHEYPLATGNPPSVVIKRAGVIVGAVTSTVPVTATPVTDDLEYFKFSSLRGNAGQFQPYFQTATIGNTDPLTS